MASSDSIKSAALAWMRFGRRYPYVCTEAGKWNADVIGGTTKALTEIEVKVSKADLKADFVNKNKHDFYKTVSPMYRGAAWIPNQMYFAVPEELKDFALEHLFTHNPKYGLVVYRGGYDLECVRVAQKLHTVAPSAKVLENILLRMGSELTNFHIYSHRYNSWLHDMKDQAKKLSGAVDIDPEDRGIIEEGDKDEKVPS